MDALLKNIRLLNPEQNLDEVTDILIINGIIKEIGNIKTSANIKTFEFENAICSPGFFDMHVHFREPGYEQAETLETGSLSAAAGGFTAVAIMPNTTPSLDNGDMIKSIKSKTQDFLVDVYPIGAVTVGRKGDQLAPLAEMAEEGAIAFSDDGVAVKTAKLLRYALEYSSMVNRTVIEHCEDESLAGGAMNEGEVSTELGLPPVPSIAEELTIARDILVAEYTNAPIHIAHISTKNSVEMVREAKKKGIKITAEVTPHHFTLTENALKSYDTNYKMNPPLRTEEDKEAIINGLKDGTIDVIASDHAPHASEDKEVEFTFAPNGIIGLETEIGLALTELYHKNHLSIEEIIYKLAINPRKILNIPVPKIEVGEKAEFTIFDKDKVWTVDVSKFKSKSKNSPFDKRLLTGKPLAVINNNQMFINS
jgi:dihydroorotase